MHLVFLPRATADLKWFRPYYEEAFPDRTARAISQYRKTLDQITSVPHMGRPITADGIREYAIPRIPFSLIYRIQGDTIEVLRLWDQRAERIENWIAL